LECGLNLGVMGLYWICALSSIESADLRLLSRPDLLRMGQCYRTKSCDGL